MNIESINGFRIGDKVRLKDGDGRPHTIKFFEIDGFKELFCVVHCEDGTEAMLHEISLLEHKGLDEAAKDYATIKITHTHGEIRSVEKYEAFKAGAKWMVEQGVSMETTDETEWSDVDLFIHRNVTGGTIVQIRKKEK